MISSLHQVRQYGKQKIPKSNMPTSRSNTKQTTILS